MNVLKVGDMCFHIVDEKAQYEIIEINGLVVRAKDSSGMIRTFDLYHLRRA